MILGNDKSIGLYGHGKNHVLSLVDSGKLVDVAIEFGKGGVEV